MYQRSFVVLLVVSACATLSHAQSLLSAEALPESTAALDTRLSAFRSELEEQRAAKAVAEQELLGLPALEHQLETTLARDVRALYRLRRGGLLPMADGLESLLGHASRVAHFERMTRRTLARLTESRQGSARLLGEVARLDARIATVEQEVAALEQSAAALVREAAASQAFEASRPASAELAPAAGYGLTIVGAPEQAARRTRFASQRGELALPVTAAATIADVAPPSGEGRALTFATRPGGSVRTVADGRVVSAEAHEGHGVLVIVDHGDRYRTVYGGLESVDVQAGDALSASARLGTASATPIYFEVRRGMRSQDARSWLGL
jgi:septal ring factor EnvC (AmiA/AmiB activator)